MYKNFKRVRYNFNILDIVLIPQLNIKPKKTQLRKKKKKQKKNSILT